jgi:hypothetical protein
MDENVIDVAYAENICLLHEQFLHNALINRRGIAYPHRHDQKLIVAISRDDSGFSLVVAM